MVYHVNDPNINDSLTGSSTGSLNRLSLSSFSFAF